MKPNQGARFSPMMPSSSAQETTCAADAEPRASSPSQLPPQYQHAISHHNITVASVNPLAAPGANALVAQHHSDDPDNAPPAKKRKLSIRTYAHAHVHAYAHAHAHANTRTHQHQTTLHQHFPAVQSGHEPVSTRALLPPSHERPHRSVNGVASALDADTDDLLHASSQPRRASRSPQAAVSQDRQHQQQTKDDKRTLRSHDEGPRLKSELAIYFPSYEDIIFDVIREEDEFLTVDTALYIIDDSTKLTKPSTSVKTPKVNARRTSVNSAAAPPNTPQRSTSNQFNGSPTLSLDFVAKTIPHDTEDPLTDTHFLKSHKRAERKEKQLRNIEKERAMHEKVQLERLLEGLLGHDWLRVLGITGVTDTEGKKYEGKRDYFIAEVQALVDKFKQWKEQEKQQRLDKEAAVAAREAEAGAEGEDDGDITEGSTEPPSSDLNASAAKQLQQETANAIKSASAKLSGKGKERAHNRLPLTQSTSHPTSTISTPRRIVTPLPLSPDVPFTSFYSKRHLRDAALSRSRHGRNLTAFGQPLPEPDEYDFELPHDYVTEDALRANARERRRRKRESAMNASSKSS